MFKTRITKLTKDFSEKGGPYYRMELIPGGTCWCWLPELFGKLEMRKGMSAMLELQESDEIDPKTDKPYMHVVGIQ